VPKKRAAVHDEGAGIAGAEGIGVATVGTGTVMGVGTAVNTTAAGMAKVDTIVVDMAAVGAGRPTVAITCHQ
jgi:hypothetical protein